MVIDATPRPPSVAVAAAPLPSPPVNTTLGADVYPLPPLVTDTDDTAAAASVAVAAAPLPLPPVNETLGADV